MWFTSLEPKHGVKEVAEIPRWPKLQKSLSVSALNIRALGCFEIKIGLHVLHASHVAVWLPLPKKHGAPVTHLWYTLSQTKTL